MCLIVLYSNQGDYEYSMNIIFFNFFQICQAIGTATKLAFQALMVKRTSFSDFDYFYHNYAFQVLAIFVILCIKTVTIFI